MDLKYTYGYGTGGTTDGTKIRTRTDNATKLTTTYSYDSQERLSYAKEADAAGVRKASWLYCFDKAGNLTHQDGAAATCPATPTYTYNDASQLTAKSGSMTGWSYDKAGNETAAASGTARTGETWGDYSQLTSITTGTTTSDLVHAGTTNDERTKLGGTWFHTTALGLTGTTTDAADTGFIREPAGTLNSMRTGDKSCFYLTDATGNVLGLVDEAGKRTHTYAYGPTGQARTTPTETTPQPYRYAGAYADQTGLYKMGARYYDPALGRFTQPDPSGQETNPYLYAKGDPVNQVDPSGLWSWGDLLKVTGGAVLTGAASGCASGAVATIWTGPGALAGCGAGAATGATAGLVGGAGGYAWTQIPW
ncbi:RHS repeat-associated core domain-containing protein [Streptomyces sp. NPDC058256]|uniref:RHS repeat-associated core domain-containing protein n=1 Tax=Streptomyces sp. NPDC058256 TaxID=3346408 RepID=UPI0036E1F010